MPEDRLEKLFSGMRLIGSIDGRIPPNVRVSYRGGTMTIDAPLLNPEGALVEVFLGSRNRAAGVDILGNVRRSGESITIRPIVRTCKIPETEALSKGVLPPLPPSVTGPENLFNMVSKLDSLPTLPGVAAKVLELSLDETKTAADLAEVIAQDPVLSAEILRLANSAYYGLRQQADTVNRAVIVLGFNRVRSALLTVSVLRMWPRGETERKPPVPVRFSEQGMWQHSLATAIATESLAEVLGIYAPENAFVAGLFHDLGKMVLDLCISPIIARALLLAARSRKTLHEAELELCGIAHERIGQWLAASWGLPEFISRAIELHHLPEISSSADPAPGLVHLGDILARLFMVGSGGGAQLPSPHPTTIRNLGLNAGLLDKVIERFAAGLARSTVFFGMLGEGSGPETITTLLQSKHDKTLLIELANKMGRRFSDTGDTAIKALLEASRSALTRMARE